MTPRSAAALIALAAELERRDAELAGRIERVRALLDEVGALRARAAETAAFLDALPAEREALAAAAAEAAGRRAAAADELAAAERRRDELAGKRRTGADALARAERELRRARETLADADARADRVAEQARGLDAAERDRRDEAGRLAELARGLAARIRELPRVSEAGRAAPGESLADLAGWASQAHAALFVVRGGLEGERERVVREAGELGAVVLGEPPVGASVAAVRRRVEQALAS